MNNPPAPPFIAPRWPAPPHVRAFFTTRQGGVSRGRWRGLNLSDRVGDDAANVAENRRILAAALEPPAAPMWLRQAHGCNVVDAAADYQEGIMADAAVATRPGAVCAVLVADCLPILLTDRGGGVVAAAHAGWRGLAAGVVEATVEAVVKAMPDRGAAELIASLGPAIGPRRYVVGEDVFAAFTRHDAAAESAFTPCDGQRWQCDLYSLARMRLAAAGVHAISGGDYCAHTDAERFFSHRRDGVTGRMAALIWIEGEE